MSDEEFAHEGYIASADPDEHVERVREIADLGADAVCLQLIGSADPMGTIRTYGETVLPKLRS
jgi:coenzyme F420-dependent glucose-6-phosphate dehydrogenase